MRSSLPRTAALAALGATAVLTLAALPAAAATYEVDPVHSSAIFKVKHFGVANFYGAFREVSGRIEYDPESPEGLAVEVTIAAASVDSRNGQRDDHLKSQDFLNVVEFPTISFRSTRVAPAGDDRYEVTGDLTLHGVTREIQVTAEKTGEGKHPRSGRDLVGFEARFAVDRTDFGMTFMAGPLSEQVEIILALEAGK
ncbi:MAG: YceI family protein [Acidobacteriota bacterium]|nr:YceI family protein [Acidobacteriota bacterium]MDH3525390.1 YceI family protein [Acidobacteriota bacterium]